jgi:predicted transcriptional regulator
MKKTGHSRYPIVDKNKRVVGMLTSKDVMDERLEERVERVMTREPITVLPTHSLASAAHEMVWEGIELLPIVNEQRRLLGVISRQDVIKALQRTQKSPTFAETLQEASMRGFQERMDKKNQLYFEGRVSPQMIDALGNWSTGALTSLLTEAAIQLLRREFHGECSVQNFTLYIMKPVQMESLVQVYPRVMDMGRKQAKVEIEVMKGQVLAIKALLTAHIIDH